MQDVDLNHEVLTGGSGQDSALLYEASAADLGTTHFQCQRAAVAAVNVRAVSIETGSVSLTCLFRCNAKTKTGTDHTVRFPS